MMSWVLLLIVAAATTTSSTAHTTGYGASTSTAMNHGAFIISSPTIVRRATTPLTSSHAQTSLVIMTAASPNQSLKNQILQGAARKLKLLMSGDDALDSVIYPPALQHSPREKVGHYTYYIREGHRSEMNAITDTLMSSFHPDSKPSFDSYIRRYKYNHVRMCFDAIDECDRGLFVACAVPTPTETIAESCLDDRQQQKQEQIVGFCSVDGRSPDPSCRVDFLTPSTLAGTSPRPYLSDLGVSNLHRRQGIGNMLVRACENWSWSRGYNRLYLKVENENIAAVRLYSKLGYTKTKLPFVAKNPAGGGSNSIILMEKTLSHHRN